MKDRANGTNTASLIPIFVKAYIISLLSENLSEVC